MAGTNLLGSLNPLKAKTSIPEQLYLPTYQNRLRVVGRHLDISEYRSISLLEVDGGILVRAFTPRRHSPELLEFPDEAFSEMVTEAIRARKSRKPIRSRTPVIPTGYEDVLRAIGYELDQRMAKTITLYEAQDGIFLAGLEKGDPQSTAFSSFDAMLGPDDVQMILDAAFRRRAR